MKVVKKILHTTLIFVHQKGHEDKIAFLLHFELFILACMCQITLALAVFKTLGKWCVTNLTYEFLTFIYVSVSYLFLHNF